jgi:predicted DNA-binding protein
MKIQVNIRLEEKTKNELQKLADADKRTLSDYIRIKLEELVGTSKKKR